VNRKIREGPVAGVDPKELRQYLRACKKLEERAIKAVNNAKNENHSVT